MKRREFIHLVGVSTLTLNESALSSFGGSNSLIQPLKKRMFLYGGDFNEKFISYVASLTGKSKPKICFLPTASGDAYPYFQKWLNICSTLSVTPSVQHTFIASSTQHKSFQDVFLDVDVIMVGGGNTLNMLAIWRAQGIDKVLKAAWEKGVILSGGSAGALCWFEHGLTDSRPIKLTTVDCLRFLPGSYCAHYDTEKERKPVYLANIKNRRLKPGYGCDDLAGMYFENQELKKVVSLNETSNVYYVLVEKGIITEKKLPKEVLI